MTDYAALDLALELYEQPDLANVVRVQPLPPGVLEVIRIAAGHEDILTAAVARLDRDAETLREAATFYVQQALFAAKDGPERTLGARPGASYETLRTHAHTLLKWLHPDAAKDDWEAAFAEQVTSAWDALKRDRGRSDMPRRHTSRSRPTTSDGRPKLYRTTTPRRRRRAAPQSAEARSAEARRLARPQLGLLAAVVLASGLIAYQIVATAMADSIVRTDPVAALAWQGRHPEAQAEAARLLLLAEDPSGLDAAREHLVAAIAASPVVSGGVRSLALVAEAREDAAAARALMDDAGALSKRDTVSQLWLFAREAEEGDFGSAMARADALLRTRPDLGEGLLPALLEFALADDARQAFLAKLAEAPPWRMWFLNQATRLDGGGLIGRSLMLDLDAAGAELSPEEEALVINRMVAGGDAQLAFLTWSSRLPSEVRASIPYVFNGDFERAPSGVLFDWAIGRATGAATEVVETAGRGHAVRIAFANRRVPYRHLQKVLLLSPGNYRLTGLVRADGLETERGLSWRVACLGEEGAQIGETEPAKGTFPWQAMSLDFTVPPGCTTQRLRLELVTRARLDQEVSGTIWFDDLKISRIPLT